MNNFRFSMISSLKYSDYEILKDIKSTQYAIRLLKSLRLCPSVLCHQRFSPVFGA